MVKTRVSTRSYIREITNFTGIRPMKSRDIDYCHDKTGGFSTFMCISVAGSGAICTGVGAASHIAGALWSGVSLFGTVACCFLSIGIINKTKKIIYYMKDGEYQKFQKKTKKIAKKSYDYPELLESIENGLKHEKKEIYDKIGKIFENSNSNTDFQEKRAKIEKDFDILRWKITYQKVKFIGGGQLRIEVQTMNQIITELAEEKWNIAKKLLGFLTLNKSAKFGSILNIIFTEVGNHFSKYLDTKIIYMVMSDVTKSLNKIEVSERQIIDALEIISKNKENILSRREKKEENKLSAMSIR